MNEETFIAIHDMDEWDNFWEANADALEDEIGDKQTCFDLACNVSLVVGGGSAPMFRVGFVD